MIAGIPQNIVLQTGNGQILTSWAPVVGATSYSVQRSTDGITYTTVGTPIVSNYVDSAVTIGVAYHYQVASVNGSGTSPYNTCFPLLITPCLPGQINLGYLRYMAQLKSDKLHSEYLTLDEWNFNINQSANELYDLLVDKYGEDYFFAPSLTIPLTGLESYPLPNGSNYSAAPAMFKLNGVDVNVGGNGDGWVPIPRANWSDRGRYTTWTGQIGGVSSGYQMAYRDMGSNLFIFPATSSPTIRIWYVPVLTQMLLDTDMMPFSISGWSEFVIVDAAMKAMIKEESIEKWQALANIKAGLIERIEVTAANRDVGQPNTISNVRATMGDPGFSGFGNGYGGGGGGGFFGGGF